MAKKKYFPNNWKRYKDEPDSFFSLGGNVYHTFDDIMEWKVGGWELPSSVACIIRVEDKETGRIKEYVYSNIKSAVKFCGKLMGEGHEFTIVDEEQVQQMSPSND